MQHAADQIQQKLAAVAGGITALGRDVVVKVRKGRLRLALAETGDWIFNDLDVSIDLPPEKIKLNLEAVSNLFDKIEIQALIDLKAFSSRGKIDGS